MLEPIYVGCDLSYDQHVPWDVADQCIVCLKTFGVDEPDRRSMEHLILRARDGRSVEVKLSGLSPAVRGALSQQFSSVGGAGNGPGMGPGMGSGMGPGMGSGMGPGGIGGGKAGGGPGGGGIQ